MNTYNLLFLLPAGGQSGLQENNIKLLNNYHISTILKKLLYKHKIGIIF